jgi:DNA-binding LacI/PurR family transcriptional regulator
MGIALQAGRSNHARVVMLQYLDKRDFLKPEGLGDLQLRGLLLACVTPPEQMNHLAALNIPVVLLDQAPMDCNVHSVTIDNFETAYDATVRLIELGHRRLAFFRSVVTNLKGIDPDSVERQQGFVMACMDAGLTEDNYKIFSAGFGESSAAATELVRARQPFSAVVTCNSVHAEQLESALRSVGLHIPRDLSIVAFQHAQKATGRWSGPAIDLREIGRRGAELIDRKPSNIERIYVDAPWYEGGSIARPRRNHV